jgi:uncharacterized membrane protein YqjE
MAEDPKKSVADLVFDVSERTSSLIREEIELAKAEVTEKVTKLVRGSVVGIVAGVFAFLALILAMEGVAWILNEEVFDNSWAGFFVEAAVFLLVAAGAGYFAYRSLKAGSPPVPKQAIEEAKLIKETIQGEDGPVGPRPPVPTGTTPRPSTAPSTAQPAAPSATPGQPQRPPSAPAAQPSPQPPTNPPSEPKS